MQGMGKVPLQEAIENLPPGTHIRAARLEISFYHLKTMPAMAWSLVEQGFQVNTYSPEHFLAINNPKFPHLEIDVQFDRVGVDE